MDDLELIEIGRWLQDHGFKVVRIDRTSGEIVVKVEEDVA